MLNRVWILATLLVCLPLIAIAEQYHQTANTNPLYVARKPMTGGYAVFDLYDDPARLRGCVGLKKVMAWLEKDGKRYPYGEGCWLMQDDGWMLFAIDAGGRQLYQSRIHRTELQWQAVTPN